MMALLKGVSLLTAVLLALLVALAYWSPPLPDSYRAPLAEWLAERLGYRVSIAGLRLGLAGVQPRLNLERVELSDPDTGAPALSLKALQLDLDLWDSVQTRSPQIEALTLVGAHLTVERTAEGRFRLQGLDGLGGGDPRVLEGFWREGRLDVVESEILLRDAVRESRLLRLTGVHLTLANAGEQHWLDLRARPVPPDPLARATRERVPDPSDGGPVRPSLRLSARLEGPPSDPSVWSGRGYLSLDGGNLGLLLPAGLTRAGRLDTERAMIEAWLNIEQGRLAPSSLRLDLQGLRFGMHDREDAEPRRGEEAPDRFPAWHLNAQARLQPSADGWTLRVAGLDLGSGRAGLSGLNLDLSLAPDGAPLGLEARASRLDLADLSTLARASPWRLPETLALLLERRPRGRVRDLSFGLDLTETEADRDAVTAPRWQVSAGLSDLGLDQRAPLPGFAGLDLTLAADQDGGRLRLETEGLDLDLNPTFDRPLRLDRLAGRLEWARQSQGGWTLTAPELSLKNADLRGQGQLDLQLPGADGRPFLDLVARFQDGNGANVRPYLPAGLMHPSLVSWLEQSIVSGRVTQGDLLFRGAPADYPFRNGRGRFELKLVFEDLRLDYQPDWPAIESAAGHLHFLNQGLSIRVERGRLLESDFSNGRVDLPDLRGVESLRIHGETRGPFEDGRRVLADTPLADKLGGLAEILDVSGRSRLVLDIDLPLTPQRVLGVSGTLSWPEPAALGLRGTAIQLARLDGAVRFDARGIEASEVKARLKGRPLTLKLETTPSGLQLAGRLDALDLGAWSDWTQATQLGQQAARRGGIALAGVAFDIERLHVGGRTLNAFELKAAPGPSGWRMQLASREVAGRIRPANPAAGQRLGLDLERLDLKALLRPPQSAEPVAPTPADSSAERGADAFSTLPSLDLHVERLDWGEQPLGTLDLALHRDALGLRLPHLRLDGSGLLTVEGVGEWVRNPEGGETRLDLKAETPNLGRVLAGFDEPAAIEAGAASTRVRLSWPGGPSRFAWVRAAGVLDIEVGAGRLLEVEPGVGRLLGFVDIGSIGRRLVLDFSDLHQQGFSFERLAGRIAIGQGQAHLDEVLIEGPAAKVSVTGRTDLTSQQLDQRVIVEPRLGSSVALASAVAGGPVVGAAVYLVDRATGNTIDRLGRYEYRLTGSWNEPEWTRLGWEPLGGLGAESGSETENRDKEPPRAINHFLDQH